MLTMIALLCLAALASGEEWSYTRCPTECICSLKESSTFAAPMRTVDCSARGLRSFPDPGSIPADAQVLDLSGNRLRKLAPSSPLWLPELQALDASSNRISTLAPGALEGLAVLRSLNLARNRLRRLADGALDGLTQLTSLDLSGNRLYGLVDAAFAGLGDLETLSLADNRLSYVGRSVWRPLLRLHDLDLSANQLGLLQAENFAALHHLNKLRLTRNRLFRLPAGAFTGLTKLAGLWLDANRLAEFPAAALKSLTGSLKSLTIGRNPLYRLSTDDLAGFERLTDVRLDNLPRLRLVERGSFKNLPNLRVLELHDSPCLRYLHPAAFANTPALSHLFLHNNNLSSLAQATVDSLPGLLELHFYGNPLVCDCNARWLRQRLDSAKILFQDADKIVCAGPAEHAFRVFARLPVEALPRHCAPRLLALFDPVSVRRLGEDIVLDCLALGNPAPRVSWIGPSGELIKPTEYHPRRHVRDGHSLVLRHLRLEDEGAYTCLAESERGSVFATASLNVTSMAVELLPLSTTARTATVAWSGEDRSKAVFQLLYRRLNAEQEQYRYAASLSPLQKSFTLKGLEQSTTYEVCLAYEDDAGVLSHISCAHMRTLKLRAAEAMRESWGLLIACILGLVTATFVLIAFLAVLVRLAADLGRRSPSYDSLAQAEEGGGFFSPFASPKRLERRPTIVSNDYAPLVPNAALL